MSAEVLELTPELEHELKQGTLLKFAQAAKNQRLAASAGAERKALAFGETKFSVLPEFYHYWGQRLGYQCWDDDQFVHEFLRDNPECRVKNVTGKMMVGGGGIGGVKAKSKVRFHKNYGEF